jgi:hypothetical protein
MAESCIVPAGESPVRASAEPPGSGLQPQKGKVRRAPAMHRSRAHSWRAGDLERQK